MEGGQEEEEEDQEEDQEEEEDHNIVTQTLDRSCQNWNKPECLSGVSWRRGPGEVLLVDDRICPD